MSVSVCVGPLHLQGALARGYIEQQVGRGEPMAYDVQL